MAVKQQYNIVGRYINEDDARDIVGYHLKNLDGTKQGKYSIEQVAFLVGKDQVLNCTAQLYKDKVLFRGKGISLESLPIQKVKINKDKTTDRAENKGKTENKVKNNTIIHKQPVKPPVNKISKPTGDELYTKLQEVISKYNLVRSEYSTLNREEYTHGPFLKLSLTLEGEDEESNFYGDKHEYILDLDDTTYYYLRQPNYLSDYIVRLDAKEGIEKFIVEAMKFLGYHSSKDIVHSVFDNIPFNSSNGFEYYSGYWVNIASILRGDTNIDKDCVIETFINTLSIVMGYESIQDKGITKIPLFRGDDRTHNQLECVNNVFMSFSTLVSIAGEFAGKEGCVLFVESAPINCLMDIHGIAVSGEEHEVLVNIGNDTSVQEYVGKIDGIPIYKAKLERALDNKSIIKYVINRYTKFIDESLFFYTLCKLVLNLKHIDQVDFVCNELTINNNDLWVKLDTDDYLNNTDCFEVQLSDNNSLTIETKEDIKLLLEYLNKTQ